MTKKVITIRIPLTVIYAVIGVVLATVLLWMTNAIPNARLKMIRPEQIESIAVFQPGTGRQATLNQEDTQVFVQTLSKVVLVGKPLLLVSLDDWDPQFCVYLKNGRSFYISCHSNHYIINGQGFNAKNTELTYRQIYTLYQSCNNRSYFPPQEIA